ncbi:substrate-binding periplasmic protein [uncultured Pseudodesulfovibrio sp.]|uniref:substrate-binding periplasmic protein n=1 Tax=uncultured Pseudodesulfovibrio sp. TaxID=2035858 RepID=UPI0037485ECE
MKYTHVSLFTTLIFVMSCMTCPAMAEEKTISMFVPDTKWPPYYVDEISNSGGSILTEILKAVAEPMGYTIKTRTLPNKRGWLMLENGEVDVHAKAKEWVDNPDDFLWTDPFMQSEDVLLLPASSTLKYTGPKSLYGKRIAAIKDFAYPKLEKDFAAGNIKRIDVLTPYDMFNLLIKGRADAALVNRVETLWTFRNNPRFKTKRLRLDKKERGHGRIPVRVHQIR